MGCLHGTSWSGGLWSAAGCYQVDGVDQPSPTNIKTKKLPRRPGLSRPAPRGDGGWIALKLGLPCCVMDAELSVAELQKPLYLVDSSNVGLIVVPHPGSGNRIK
ncbi:hypothetical protein BN2497_14147 [Janthinobacterium sp. CG23_2]|nr:hypothetical protein BN2497_14147 [Janthinobacterium sp. CG23_2]CUU33471.1 hypothetical protein BN3177_14147 [Janthinobacterium sp. CG23_2]